jgi:hypothetical protein
MGEHVTVVLSHPWRDPEGDEHSVGDKVDLDPDQARQLVRAGAGRFATKTGAKTAGGDPEDFTQTASVTMPTEVRETSKKSRRRGRGRKADRGAGQPAELTQRLENE